MKIDITGPPPVDIFRDRKKHLLASIVLLTLVGLGLTLMLYGVLTDTQVSEIVENVALALLVGPAVVFTYYGSKLNDYKGLSVSQKKELADLSRKHAKIAAYCVRVGLQKRQMIHAEYEACVDWGENISLRQNQKEK